MAMYLKSTVFRGQQIRPKFAWAARRCGLLALTLALTLTLAATSITPGQAKSDWIDGDAEEVPLQPPRAKRPRAPINVEQPNQDNGAAGLSPEDLTPPAPVLKIDASGQSRIQGGISSSAAASATFRGTPRVNRGLDSLSNQFLSAAPFLDTPKTVIVQPSSFKAWLERNHPGQAALFNKNTIVEIKGRWDDCGHVIHSFGLPATRVSSNSLTTTDLSKTRILVVNCGADFNEQNLAAVRQFVDSGGYLLTTDWALDSCLQKAFPGYVEWNGGYTENSVVDAVVVDRDPILLAGVPKVAHWKLEDKSQLVKVVRSRGVQVLARSRFLMQQDPSNLGILALTFPFGAGRVLHLVGHFDNNADRASNAALPDPAPIIGIGLRQAIAANFITAALQGDIDPREAQN
jgi:hypothetical protein